MSISDTGAPETLAAEMEARLEIDYAELLRGQVGGDAPELADLIDLCLKGRTELSLDEAAWQTLAAVATDDPESPASGAAHLSRRHGRRAASTRAATILHLLRGVAQVTSQTQPERFDAIFRKMADAAARLSPEVMISLLEAGGTPEAMLADLDVVRALADRIDTTIVTEFIAGSSTTDAEAAGKLARALELLLPDLDQRWQMLQLAQSGQGEPASVIARDLLARPELLEQALHSPPHPTLVSHEPARQLPSSGMRAPEVKPTSDDPPERLASWLSSVSDLSVWNLDTRLLLDLLAIQRDPSRWRELLDMVVTHVSMATRAGQIEAAFRLTDMMAREAERGAEPTRALAVEALARLAKGSLAKDAVVHLRSCEFGTHQVVKRLLHAVGPAVIAPLAEAWSAEQDPRVRQRVQQVVIGFGALGRASVGELVNAPDWELRRAAVCMLREFDGTEVLGVLEKLLRDADARVQRETIRVLATRPDGRAHSIILSALTSSPRASRVMFLQELLAVPERHAVSLLAYLIRHLNNRGEFRAFRLSATSALARFGGAQAIEALGETLCRGGWWPPRPNRRLRQAAARALGRIGTNGARQALQQASTQGPRGARLAARRELARMASS